MSVEASVVSGVLTIKIGGRFDFGVHKQMREATNLATADVKKIEVDLSNTDYLDSSALGMLLVLRDKIAGDKHTVSIKGARAEVKKILEIANFDKLFSLS
ncbi:STAS domain-containing protein [Methylomonas sp. LL1]|uniref:STAS domain-containing protein n=1 Tax=Methylomonas sp. LL1 TaxID=2785785 RepID=UPI0018C3CCAE|nr:STAS domain-containing protein [Methylomonas sp. LL1]QPK64197.1 STAS domain-containing protein [Methylomonas sp. LL1]